MKNQKNLLNEFGLFLNSGAINLQISLAGRRRKKSKQSDSSQTSSISTAEMELIVEDLRVNQHRSTTKKSYYSVWKSFNAFFVRLDVKPDNWEDRLVLFIAYLAKEGKKMATIKSYISAIKATLKSAGIKLNPDEYLLSSLTCACKLRNKVIRCRLPIGKGLLKIILITIEKLFSCQPYLETLFKAILATMYFGLFRVGELALSQHAVKAEDVHIVTNKRKLMFILRSLKTHTAGSKPQIIKISNKETVQFKRKGNKDATKQYCLYQLLTDYLAKRNGQEMPGKQFFVFSDNSPVKPSNVRAVLKKNTKNS